MRIAIVVSGGLERSGLVVFASRLVNEFFKCGEESILIVKGSWVDGIIKPYQILVSEQELKDWVVSACETYDVLLWAGFDYDLKSIEIQVLVSIWLRESVGKRVFFIWERTGFVDVIPDQELLNSLLHRGTDGVFVFNEGHMDYLRRIAPHQIIHLTSPGIDTHNQFKPVDSKLERSNLRKKFNWPSDRVIVLSLGRFVRRKRTDWLLSTWLQDSTLGMKAQLVLIGSGFDQEDSVEENMIKLAGKSESVSIIPHNFKTEWVSFYHAADLLVLAGVLEGEPSILSEAMACGLPIIASKIPGHRGLVYTGKTGLLFEPDNTQELCSALHTLIDDDSYRKKLGQAARITAASYRDISIVSEHFLRVMAHY